MYGTNLVIMNTDLVEYYKARAAEYEKIYQKPERQVELAMASKLLAELFAGQDILEIACGTGYWTERIAQTARSIMATDINEAVLAIAMQKEFPKDNVQFAVADIYSFKGIEQYQGVFGGFILSHIEYQQTLNFINNVNRFVKPGGTVVLMDNIYVGGSSLPIAETDEEGNTYQLRTLENGTLHRVLKNFQDEGFLRDMLTDSAGNVEYFDLKYYWVLKYTVA